ncbi:GR101-like protein, partial [Mya arenaria]
FPPCNPDSEFTCNNGQCIPLADRCDASFQCLDNSDELNCAFCNDQRAFTCTKRQCIPKHYVCDDVTDCLDQSDEKNCYVSAYYTCDDVLAEETYMFMLNATDSGYVCSVEVPFKFTPEIKEVIKVEYALNDTAYEEIDAYPDGSVCDIVEDFAKRRGINLGPLKEKKAIYRHRMSALNAYLNVVGEKNAIVITYRRDFDNTVFRLDIGPVVCEKGCEEEEQTVIVLSYGYSREDSALAFKFASKFVNDLRPTYVIKVTQEKGNLQYKLFERRFPSDHISITEIWSSNNLTFVVGFLTKTSNVLISFLPTPSFKSVETELLYSNSKNVGKASLYRLVNEKTQTLLRIQNVSEKYNGLSFIVKEVRISNKNLVVNNGWNLIPNLCKTNSTHKRCVNGYRCDRCHVCLDMNQVCDGVVQCPNGDDEQLCNFQCPENCACTYLSIVCTNGTIGWQDVNTFPHQSRTLHLGPTNDDRVINIISLNVSNSGIKEVSGSSLKYLPNIKVLDISYNNITVLKKNTFINMKYLAHLVLNGNEELVFIEPGAFNGLKVHKLSLKQCGLTVLETNTFKGLTMKELDLSQNNIHTVNDLAFNDLSVNTLKLKNNPLSNFGKDIFRGVLSLSELQTPSFKFCCIRPSYLLEEKCEPRRDEISSCDDLIVNSALQALLWVTGLLAVLGNMLSLLFRFMYDRQHLKHGYGIFVSNLAAADLLMGLYMLIIGIADTNFRGRYIEVDERWRTSYWCHFAGVLSTCSSEASVLFICLITLDRILVIKYPFGQVRFSTASAVMTALACWIVAFMVATIPLLPGSYFDGKFYTSRAVCTALPLTRDRQSGWSYSFAIFIGFNFVSFIFIAFGQSIIFYEIRQATSRRARLNVTISNDLKVARNLLLVIATDFLCWFPVGLMGMLALFDVSIPGEAYAWTVVLVLPVNSALNPFLYTLSMLLDRER